MSRRMKVLQDELTALAMELQRRQKRSRSPTEAERFTAATARAPSEPARLWLWDRAIASYLAIAATDDEAAQGWQTFLSEVQEKLSQLEPADREGAAALCRLGILVPLLWRLGRSESVPPAPHADDEWLTRRFVEFSEEPGSPEK